MSEKLVKTGDIEVVSVVDHEDGSATYTFDMTEEISKICSEMGLKLLLYSGMTGISATEIFELVWERYKYLQQEPEDSAE